MKKLIFVIFAICVICWASATRAEEKKFSTTAEQKLRLENKQLKVQIAFSAYQDSLRALADEAEHVKRENNWPADLMFSMQTLEFNAPQEKPMPQKKEPPK